MNFFKKNHKLVDQNEKSEKKPHKHDANLQKNTMLYFQVGLILCLLTSYELLELQFKTSKTSINDDLAYEDTTSFIESPTFKIEQVKEPDPEPVQKKIITSVIKEVPDDTTIKDNLNDIITEPEPTLEPGIDPGDIFIEDIPEDIPVPVNFVQNVPIYPGCERHSSNDKRKKCMSDKITKLVSKKFNNEIAGELGLNGKQRIQVQFKIDKSGNVTDIKARAAHPGLEREAIKVVNKIPHMIPGKQNDKNVGVIYNLPITLQVQN
ncbi:energy transducer TonB [Flavobacteriaceae bacterium AU392]|nr:energy transducer TonB [Flavobacteriaceae bacterium]RKM81640.1 energy transducer TonB [Flavobacteriaceae bacterium AU392]